MAHLISGGGADAELRLRPLTTPRFPFLCPGCGDSGPDAHCPKCWTHGCCSVTDRFYDGAVLSTVPHGRGRMLFLFTGSSYFGNFHSSTFKGKGRYTWFEGSVLYAEWSRGEPVRDSRFAGVDGTRLYDMTYVAGALEGASRLILPRGAGEVRRETPTAAAGGGKGAAERKTPAPTAGNAAGDAVATAGAARGTREQRLAGVQAASAAATPRAPAEYRLYLEPSFGLAHFSSHHARNCQVPLLLLPSLLFAAAMALDWAAFGTAYLGETCRMTNPLTRSCFGQDFAECCRGEVVDAVGFGALAYIVLIVAAASVVAELWRGLDLTVAGRVLPVLHFLGLSPAYYATRLILALQRGGGASGLTSAVAKDKLARSGAAGAGKGKGKKGAHLPDLKVPAAGETAAAGSDGPQRGGRPALAGARSAVVSMGMGGRPNRGTSFGDANPLAAGGGERKGAAAAAAGGDLRSRTASVVALSGAPTGDLVASSPDPHCLLHTGAPWLFSGTSKAQLSRVVRHAVPALLLHGYGLYSLWTWELEFVPPLAAVAPLVTALALWWHLVAADVGGLSTKSLRFLRPPPDVPLWKDPKMSSLFVLDAPDSADGLWLTAAVTVSALFRGAELASRFLILGGVLGVTRGAMLALLLPLWAATYYVFAAWSYPRERDLPGRAAYTEWALPRWPAVAETQAAEVAAGPTPAPTAAAPAPAPPTGARSAVTSGTSSGSSVAPPTLPALKGGLKGGGKEDGAGGAPASDTARSGAPQSARPPFSGRAGDAKDLPGATAGASARGAAAGKRTPPVATGAPPPCSMRCRHCCQAYTVRCGDCVRPWVRDGAIWWRERAVAPWDERFLLSLVAFPAPNWSPLFPTVASVGAPLTARFHVWQFFAARAVEDILGLLLYAAVQRYGENDVHSFLDGSALGPVVRAWCCMDALWLALVAATLIKYTLLPVYLNLFQLLAQPPLDDDEEGAEGGMGMSWWRRVNPNKVPDWATEAQPGQAGYKSAHRPSAIAGQVMSPAAQKQLAGEEAKASRAARAGSAAATGESKA